MAGAKIGLQLLQQVANDNIKPKMSALNSLKFWSDPQKLEKVLTLPKSLLRGTQLLKTIFGRYQPSIKISSKVAVRCANLLRVLRSRLAEKVGLKKAPRKIPSPKIAVIVVSASSCATTSTPKSSPKSAWKTFSSMFNEQIVHLSVTIWIRAQPGFAEEKTSNSFDAKTQVHLLTKKALLTSSNVHVTPCFYLEIMNKLGEGGQGAVMKGSVNFNDVAFKIMKQFSSPDGMVMHEAKMLASLCHENIVSVFGVLVEPTKDIKFMVMELMENGSLDDLLFCAGVKLTRQEVIRIALDVARGLQYLHSQNIAHLDIKPANILLNNKRAKISDFGCATRLAQNYNGVGTWLYSAPEISEETFTDKSDVYSFGATLFAMVTSMHLGQLGELACINKIHCCVDDVPLRELIVKCCRADPTERPSMTECVDVLIKM